MTKRKPLRLMDSGTPELRQHHALVLEGDRQSRMGGANEPHMRVVDQRPLDRYALRGELAKRDQKLNAAMYAAGSRLRDDWVMAGMTPRMTVDLLAVGGGGGEDFSTAKTAARQRCINALREIGPAVSDMVIHVACLDGEAAAWASSRGWHRGADGLPVLRLGLEHLARHYRLLK